MGFCWNSRKWDYSLALHIPKSCVYYNEQGGFCEHCGYYEIRKITPYVKERLRILRSIGD